LPLPGVPVAERLEDIVTLPVDVANGVELTKAVLEAEIDNTPVLPTVIALLPLSIIEIPFPLIKFTTLVPPLDLVSMIFAFVPAAWLDSVYPDTKSAISPMLNVLVGLPSTGLAMVPSYVTVPISRSDILGVAVG
tara:strand:- start:36 stop:440 length:405 start_codon:yes stop_codon:yes gene_type:complete